MLFNKSAFIVDGDPGFERITIQDKNPVSRRTKMRQIAIPNAPMRAVHRRIRVALELQFPVNPFEEILSPHSGAEKHRNGRYFYQTDLRNAFGSVPLKPLAKIIAASNQTWNEDEVAEVLEEYCYENGGKGLITGLPASPMLFSIYARHALDAPLHAFWPPFQNYYKLDAGALGRKLGKQFTRFVDDLTFSSPEWISEDVRRMIRNIIESAGFEVNHRKSTVKDIRKGPIIITGVGLEYRPNQRARMFVPGHYVNRARGMIHMALKGKGTRRREEIEGMMSVFSACFGGKKMNQRRNKEGLMEVSRTDQKLMEMFLRYRSLVRR
jgi:hypothetical protein